MSEKTIIGLNCPSCGGTLDVREGKKTVECGFCETTLILSGELGLPRYYVRDEITRDQVKRATYKWLGTIDKAPDLQKSYKLEELFLIFVPFFRVRTHAVGWILGKNEVGSGREKHFVPVEKKIDRVYDWNSPACELSEFGVEWANLEGDTLRPFTVEEVQPRGMVFDPAYTVTETDKNAIFKFEDWAREEAALDLITFKKLHFLNLETSIIYYPLWIFRYRYRNRIYQVVFDAEDGSMLHGTAPGNSLFRIFTLVGTMFLGNLLLTTSIRSGNIIAALILFVGALILFPIAYRKFRFGSEVEYKVTPKGPKMNTLIRLSKKITIESLIEMAGKV